MPAPEHEKLEKIWRVNPAAGDLLHLLLENDGWELVNSSGPEPVSVSFRHVAAQLLGVDLDALDEEHANAMAQRAPDVGGHH